MTAFPRRRGGPPSLFPADFPPNPPAQHYAQENIGEFLPEMHTEVQHRGGDPRGSVPKSANTVRNTVLRRGFQLKAIFKPLELLLGVQGIESWAPLIKSQKF